MSSNTKAAEEKQISLVWLRRGLRVHDHRQAFVVRRPGYLYKEIDAD